MPIAHSAAGAAAFVAFSPRAFIAVGKARWVVLAACLFLANLPDLDFLPGMLLGEPNRFHQSFSHSLFFMFGCAVLVFFLLNASRRNQTPVFPASRLLLCLLAAGLSHPVLDFFSLDTSTPQGVPLFWPLTTAHFSSPWPLFLNVERSGASTLAFLQSLISSHNFKGAFREMVFSVALFSLVAGTHLHPWPGWLIRVSGIAIIFALFALPLLTLL